MCVCLCMGFCTWLQKLTEAGWRCWMCRKWEVQAAMSHLAWVVGTILSSSTITVSILNPWVIPSLLNSISEDLYNQWSELPPQKEREIIKYQKEIMIRWEKIQCNRKFRLMLSFEKFNNINKAIESSLWTYVCG